MVEEFRFVVAAHRFDASSHHLAHFLVSGFDLVHDNIQRRAADTAPLSTSLSIVSSVS
jgi:hypothetical protein